jgi:hypothetical protein
VTPDYEPTPLAGTVREVMLDAVRAAIAAGNTPPLDVLGRLRLDDATWDALEVSAKTTLALTVQALRVATVALSEDPQAGARQDSHDHDPETCPDCLYLLAHGLYRKHLHAVMVLARYRQAMRDGMDPHEQARREALMRAMPPGLAQALGLVPEEDEDDDPED